MAGGGICGAAILVFGAFIGRSGTTGTEYFGYWHPRNSSNWFVLWRLIWGHCGTACWSISGPKNWICGRIRGSSCRPPLAVLTGICGFFFVPLWT